MVHGGDVVADFLHVLQGDARNQVLLVQQQIGK